MTDEKRQARGSFVHLADAVVVVDGVVEGVVVDGVVDGVVVVVVDVVVGKTTAVVPLFRILSAMTVTAFGYCLLQKLCAGA
jgi:large-conductance mechanosensitive channel